MRRFLFIPLAALVGIGLAGLFRFFFPRESAPAPAPVAAIAAEEKAARASSAAPVSAVVQPWPTGYVALGSRVTVQMSDGTTRIEHRPNEARAKRLGLDAEHGEVTDIDRNAVIIEGEKVFIRPAPRAASSPTVLGGSTTAAPAIP